VLQRSGRSRHTLDLPVERPVKFDLLINLKTAKTFGFDIARTFLARVEEVIE
jgi:putative tryptophan/tyrosine transport system substrate-binding protein